MTEEWGPWIEHDGKGCPLPNGMQYSMVFEDGDEAELRRGECIARTSKMGFSICDYGEGAWEPSWLWEEPYCKVIRYRIRKPRGMAILKQLLADIPAPVAPEVVQ